MSAGASVDLYWLPLGAGGHSVRWNGRIYEAVVARVAGRLPRDLYHSALEVRVRGGGRFVIEQGPAGARDGRARGVAARGPVASRWAAGSRLFRYEVRCWPDGSIPDVDEAVESPQRLTTDPVHARRLLELVPDVPALTWGRDESHVGDMWNSNSVVAWLIAGSGIETGSIRLPAGGRAPGWAAGLRVARRRTPAASSARAGDT